MTVHDPTPEDEAAETTEAPAEEVVAEIPAEDEAPAEDEEAAAPADETDPERPPEG